MRHEVHVPVHDRYVQGRLTWTRELLAWALPQDPARCPSYLHRILQGDPPVSTRSAFLGEDEMGGGGGERAWWDSQGPPVLPASSYFSGFSLLTFMHWRRKRQPSPVFLPGEFQGRGSLLGCRLWGHTESDTTEVT